MRGAQTCCCALRFLALAGSLHAQTYADQCPRGRVCVDLLLGAEHHETLCTCFQSMHVSVSLVGSCSTQTKHPGAFLFTEPRVIKASLSNDAYAHDLLNQVMHLTSSVVQEIHGLCSQIGPACMHEVHSHTSNQRSKYGITQAGIYLSAVLVLPVLHAALACLCAVSVIAVSSLPGQAALPVRGEWSYMHGKHHNCAFHMRQQHVGSGGSEMTGGGSQLPAHPD